MKTELEMFTREVHALFAKKFGSAMDQVELVTITFNVKSEAESFEGSQLKSYACSKNAQGQVECLF